MDFRSSAAELIRDKFHPACPASAITCVRQVLVLHIGKPVQHAPPFNYGWMRGGWAVPRWLRMLLESGWHTSKIADSVRNERYRGPG
jgi:hypothetical protein